VHGHTEVSRDAAGFVRAWRHIVRIFRNARFSAASTSL